MGLCIFIHAIAYFCQIILQDFSKVQKRTIQTCETRESSPCKIRTIGATRTGFSARER